MEQTTGTLQHARERANELYWGSDTSVNRIAQALDLSRGALYALIRPLPTGLPCPECSGELQYSNRTARERTLMTCAVCGLEEGEALVRGEWQERAAASPSGAVVVDGGDGRSRSLGLGGPVSARGKGLLIGALALAGVAALLYAARRR